MSFSMHDGHDDDAPMGEINVTPLVDVMLVLLIVFMITMPVLTHSIPINLPTASEQTSEKDEPQEKDIVRLSIDVDGKYYLGAENTTPIPLEQLSAELKKSKQANDKLILGIIADKNVVYDHVAQALDAAKNAEISRVGVITKDKE